MSLRASSPLAIFYIITIITLASSSLLFLVAVGAPTAAAAKSVSSKNLDISSSDEIHNMAITHGANSGGRGHQDSDIATESGGDAVTQSSENTVTQSGNDSHISQRTVNTLPLPSGVAGVGATLGIKDTTLLNTLLSSSSSITNANSAAGSSSPLGNTKCIVSVLKGGTSNVTIKENLIIGTDCDDMILGDGGNNIIFTLAGNDEANGGNGNDIIYAGSGEDRMYGAKGNDVLVGGLGTNLLDGGPGDDMILGGPGNDLLIGGPGDDVITAGAGTSIMYGGINADKFDCGSSISSSSAAIVMDYNPNEGDTITGKCKLVNTVGNAQNANNNNNNIPNINLPDTGDTTEDNSNVLSSGAAAVLGGGGGAR
jgi:Ca2+-binding RTX toxin-like protein